jgi:hypothetical protein
VKIFRDNTEIAQTPKTQNNKINQEKVERIDPNPFPTIAKNVGHPTRPTCKIMSAANLSCESGMCQTDSSLGLGCPRKIGFSSPVASR